MQKLTASNIVSFINQLDKNVAYGYVNPKTKGLIQITGIDLPEGPIRINRSAPSKGEIASNKREVSISQELIWRLANAFVTGQTINVDRV